MIKGKKLWVKLWLELLDDPKICTLSDELYRFVMELYMYAGEKVEEGKEGYLPQDVAHWAWRLRRTEEDINEMIPKLINVGVLRTDGELYYVHGWERRQSPQSDRQRKQAQRWRDQMGHGNVTKDVTLSDHIKKDIKKDIKIKKKATTLLGRINEYIG